MANSNFIRSVKQVVECINETPGAHLLLVSMIPSPENHYNNGPVFRLADDEMRKLANEHAKVSFLDLSKNFLRNRQLKPELFNQHEKTAKKKPVHLSKEGAAMVATKLRQKCMSIPKNCFNIE